MKIWVAECNLSGLVYEVLNSPRFSTDFPQEGQSYKNRDRVSGGTMTRHSSSWMFPLAIATLVVTMGSTTMAYKSFNEVCTTTPSRPDDSQRCDPAAFLTCGLNRLCSCSPSLTWMKELGQCAYSVRETCADSSGRPSWPNGGAQGGNGPAPGCPKNAFCDVNGDRRCACDSGFTPSEDNLECNGGYHLQPLSYLTMLIFFFGSTCVIKALY